MDLNISNLSQSTTSLFAEHMKVRKTSPRTASTAFDFDELESQSANAVSRIAALDCLGKPRGECNRCDCPAWVESDFGGYCARAFRIHPSMLSADVCEPAVSTNAPLGLEHCRRCGCDHTWHSDLSELIAKLEARGALVEAEEGWNDLQKTIFRQSQGLFKPNSWGDFCHDTDNKAGWEDLRHYDGMAVVTVICPTVLKRRHFGGAVYRNFLRQTYHSRQLVIVETGSVADPASFFTSGPAAQDMRVTYKYFQVTGQDLTIGAKRNIANFLAFGDIIVHFDDDDIYAPEYLEVMVDALRHGKAPGGNKVLIQTNDNYEGVLQTGLDISGYVAQEEKEPARPLRWDFMAAEISTLSSWRTLELSTGRYGFCDVDVDAGEEERRREWTLGYGFSFAYLRDAWRTSWYQDMSLGEDTEFAESLLARGARAAVLRDVAGQFCAHTRHGTNCSGREMDGDLPSMDSPVEGIFAQMVRDLVRDFAPLAHLSAKRTDRKLRKDEALQLLDDFMAGFSSQAFQQRLHDAWNAAAGNPGEQEKTRRELCLEVQGPVLSKHGFEANRKGLMDCATLFSVELNSDHEIANRNAILHALARPQNQSWLKEQGLSIFAVDPSHPDKQEINPQLWGQFSTSWASLKQAANRKINK